MKISSKIALFFSLTICASSWAYVECSVSAGNFYSGENIFWVNWKQGGSGVVPIADPTYKTTVAAVMLAVAMNKNMTVRFSDGKSCSGMANQISGIWVLN